MLTEKQITKDNADESIRRLYETAFPQGEQIPWEDLVRLIEAMPLDFTAYYEDEQFIGFTITYPRRTFNWFWYFAVREELREKGYGRRIFSQLMKKYQGQPSVLDMESPYQEPCPNPEQRKRRHAFYVRQGFRDTHLFKTYNGITMTIMMAGPGTFTMQDWDDIVGELKRFWWPE